MNLKIILPSGKEITVNHDEKDSYIQDLKTRGYKVINLDALKETEEMEELR